MIASLLLLTIAMTGPQNDVRVPRNRAVVMLTIDVSQSMRATDVEPSRLVAAQVAAKQFADQLTPGINLGLIAFAGTATVLVSPTTNREAMLQQSAHDRLPGPGLGIGLRRGITAKGVELAGDFGERIRSWGREQAADRVG